MRYFVCTCLALVFVTEAFTQEFTVFFKPPTGAILEVLTDTQRTRTTKSVTHETSAKVKGYIAVEKEQDGYACRLRVRDAVVSAEGKPVDNPLLKAMFTLDITTHFDAEGDMVDVSGIDEAFTKVLASLPPQMQVQARQLLSKDALLSKERANWRTTLGMLVGQTLHVGQEWEEPTTYEIPMGGTVHYDAQHKVTELIACGQQLRCLRVVSKSIGRSEDYAEVMRALTKGTAAEAELVDASFEIYSTFDRVVHPETGMVYEEKLATDTVITVETKKDGTDSNRQGEMRHARYRILEGDERAVAKAFLDDRVMP